MEEELKDIHVSLQIIRELVELCKDLQSMTMHEESKKVKEAITLLVDKFDLSAIRKPS